MLVLQYWHLHKSKSTTCVQSFLNFTRSIGLHKIMLIALCPQVGYVVRCLLFCCPGVPTFLWFWVLWTKEEEERQIPRSMYRMSWNEYNTNEGRPAANLSSHSYTAVKQDLQMNISCNNTPWIPLLHLAITYIAKTDPVGWTVDRFLSEANPLSKWAVTTRYFLAPLVLLMFILYWEEMDYIIISLNRINSIQYHGSKCVEESTTCIYLFNYSTSSAMNHGSCSVSSSPFWHPE